MSDKETDRIPRVFLCTTGTDYMVIRCKTCGQPWMFNKNLPPPIKTMVAGEWECSFCKRGYIQVKE